MAGKAMDIGTAGERFARNITAVRTAKRLTYTELSALLSDAGRAISPLAVRRIEAGERKADAQDIVSLSEVLRVSVEQLLFSDVEVTAEYKVGK